MQSSKPRDFRADSCRWMDYEIYEAQWMEHDLHIPPPPVIVITWISTFFGRESQPKAIFATIALWEIDAMNPSYIH